MKKEDKLPYYKWRIGDRYDGWRVRKVDTVFSVIPYFFAYTYGCAELFRRTHQN